MNTRMPVLLASVVLAATATHADPKKPCDSSAMKAGAEAYMVAMINGSVDPTLWDRVPLAPHARRVEHPPGTYNGTPARGGPVTGKTGFEIRYYSTSLPTLHATSGLRDHNRPDRQWFNPETCEMVAWWLIDLGARDRTGGGAQNFGTAHVAERWKFTPLDHTIVQIEAYFFQNMTPGAESCWPPAGDEGTASSCTTDPTPVSTHCAPTSEDRMLAAVQSYLDALKSHDPSAVPLAADVRRTEMPWPAGGGPVTATNADDVRRSLREDPRFTSVSDVRETRWFVDRHNCTVMVFYVADAATSPTNEPIEPGVPFSVHVGQRFHVSKAEITQIEHIAYPHQNRQPEGSCWTGFDNERHEFDSDANRADYQYMALPCPAGY